MTKIFRRRKNIVEKCLAWQQNKIIYPFAHLVLAFLAVEIPKEVVLAKNVRFCHRSPGTVIHPNVRIDDNVQIYQNVTIGLSKPWLSARGGVIIRENAILGAGCKVLFQDDLVIGKGTVIGANSVLLCSTGENEIWAGIPAKCVGKRE